MFNNQLTKARKEKSERLKTAGMNPFPAIEEEFLESNLPDFQSFYKTPENLDGRKFLFTGRVMLLRKMGKSGFFTFQGKSNKRQQVFCSLKEMGDNYPVFKNMLDIGDIIKIEGVSYFTKTGELTVLCKKLTVLTKALSPLPEKFHGLEDSETRYRQRYLDMIMNLEVKKTMILRSKIINLLRNIMNKYNFLEVETPVLNNIPGGANAKPFITHHNALDAERFLRIAPELYLKRLVVGGMDRVFEIGKNFRNEGIDATHNPEFTSMEFYSAYTNYKMLMEFIELLFRHIIETIQGSQYKIKFGEQVIDFNSWKQIPYREALITIGNIPEDIIDKVEPLLMYLREHDCEKANETLSRGKLWEIAFDEFVEKEIVDPVFITDYPIEISPLARRSDRNHDIAERFELFIAGREIANGFNELNDPEDQYERFIEQVSQKENDDESMHMDKDFIKALMIGMPPTAGAGIGIDRLVMLLTNSESIKDVIAFPAMK